MKSATNVLALVVLFSASLALAQTGKIAGKVTDSRTNEPVVGANVVVEGTTMGAATDFEGFFTILNIPPGTYR
jgi:hypothetical protein